MSESGYYDYRGCLTPISVKNPHYFSRPWEDQYFLVPCGKCANCIKRKRNEWFFRLSAEAKSSLPFFITLTYDDNHLPHDDDGQPCFNVRHCQLFIKRLRKKGYKFRYFLASEYGSDTKRPHYHAILFMDCSHYPVHNLCVDVDNAWKLGFTSVSDSNPARISYVVNYLLFKSDVEDGRQPPLCFAVGGRRSVVHSLQKISKTSSIRKEKDTIFILMDEALESLAFSALNLCQNLFNNITVIMPDCMLRLYLRNIGIKSYQFLIKSVKTNKQKASLICSLSQSLKFSKKTISFSEVNIVENSNILNNVDF